MPTVVRHGGSRQVERSIRYRAGRRGRGRSRCEREHRLHSRSTHRRLARGAHRAVTSSSCTSSWSSPWHRAQSGRWERNASAWSGRSSPSKKSCTRPQIGLMGSWPARRWFDGGGGPAGAGVRTSVPVYRSRRAPHVDNVADGTHSPPARRFRSGIRRPRLSFGVFPPQTTPVHFGKCRPSSALWMRGGRAGRRIEPAWRIESCVGSGVGGATAQSWP
jgi:hypothetical protein